MTQSRLIELTHPENGTRNRNARQGAVIQAEGVFVREVGGQAISSTPQACGLVLHHPRRGAHGAGAYRAGVVR
jgi:hypothetical protein